MSQQVKLTLSEHVNAILNAVKAAEKMGEETKDFVTAHVSTPPTVEEMRTFINNFLIEGKEITGAKGDEWITNALVVVNEFFSSIQLKTA